MFFPPARVTSHTKQMGRRWLIAFMAYGWGIAAILTYLVIYLDGCSSIPEEYRPSIGKNTCFIDG